MGVYSSDSGLKPQVLQGWIDEMLRDRGPEVVQSVVQIRAADPHMPLSDALRKYIQQSGTVNHTGEIQAELREIRNEIWYHGVLKQSSPTDEEKAEVSRRWVDANAKSWRHHLVNVYAFTVDSNKQHYEKALCEMGASLNIGMS